MSLRCTYCGDTPAEDLDHVIPVAYTNNRTYTKDLVVPCCKECNGLLGSKSYMTIGDRAGYLAKAYRKKYAKVLKYPTWTQEELDELNGRLRQNVQQGQLLKALTQMRIEYCEYIRIISPSIADVWKDQ